MKMMHEEIRAPRFNARRGCGALQMEVLDTMPATITIDEAAAVLGVSRNSAYSAVARGEIPAIRIGRRLLVPKAALERLLESAETPK
jgi:excisionase family DNA binding protein